MTTCEMLEARSVCSFNGAATVRSRIARTYVRTLELADAGFNGAATVRSRIASASYVTGQATSAAALQWGRDRQVADRTPEWSGDEL